MSRTSRLPLGLGGSLLAGALLLSEGADAGSGAGGSATEGELARRAVALFESKCFRCHGPDPALSPKGELRLSSREALLAGGESGPAVVPGAPDASTLLRRVRSLDPEVRMPPKGELLEEEVALLWRWVDAGAPWPEVDPGAVELFTERVLPVLTASCFPCHGPEVLKPKGRLRMSGGAALLEGGSRGPAIAPGDPEGSLLVQAIRREHPELAMPPDDPLSAEAIRDVERWIELGAPWPSTATSASAPDEALDLERAREWWSFRPLRRPAVPDVEGGAGLTHPIDSFLRSALEAEGLEPNAMAEPRSLVRRAYFDLLGVPPTLAEVEDFEADRSPDRWERLVDRLLERPEYGERQAQHWLDLVRFGQSNGYERDHEKPFAWRYRDYVVRAFRDDKPYDRFILEQLAGDELDEVTREALIATGFYRIGAWDAEPADPAEALFDEKDDMLRVIGEGLLGVTIGCARCHDHEYDPFRQEDYYGLLAFIDNVRPYEVPRYTMDSATLVPLDFDQRAWIRWQESRGRWLVDKQAKLDALVAVGRERFLAQRRAAGEEELQREPTLEESTSTLAYSESRRAVELQVDLDEIDERYSGGLDWVLAVREKGGVAADTNVLVRGRAASPGASVVPSFPPVLVANAAAARPALPARAADAASTGRRRVLAEWIASAENPLTARVLVNRLWQFHFGRGLVETPNDFGTRGALPTHPELLDWLASECIDGGWSMKRLHRLMLTSAAYRMTSSTANAPALAADPANLLFWRQNPRRLEAEALRDSMLEVSGTLNPAEGGRGFFPELSREAFGGASRPGNGWELSPPLERDRRSLYAFEKRGVPVPLLETFDCPSPALPTGRRQVTTTATQALVLLNSGFANEKAAAFAERVLGEAGPSTRACAARAFELALSRTPTDAELQVAEQYLSEQTQAFAERAPTLVFRPRVPRRIDTSYLAQVDGQELTYGPRTGWTYFAGEWGDFYNRTAEALEGREPAALLDAPLFVDGTVEANVRPRNGCERAALLVRATEEQEVVTGIEVALDVPAQALAVTMVQRGEPIRLGSRAVHLEPEQSYRLTVTVEGSRLSVTLGEAELVVDDLPITTSGSLGVRTVGDGVELEELTLRTARGVISILPDDTGSPELRALESLCLTLFNLNEYIWVD